MVSLRKLPSVSPLHTSRSNPEPHFDLYGYNGKEHVVLTVIDTASGPIVVGVSKETGKLYRIKFK